MPFYMPSASDNQSIPHVHGYEYILSTLTLSLNDWGPSLCFCSPPYTHTLSHSLFFPQECL